MYAYVIRKFVFWFVHKCPLWRGDINALDIFVSVIVISAVICHHLVFPYAWISEYTSEYCGHWIGVNKSLDILLV